MRQKLFAQFSTLDYFDSLQTTKPAAIWQAGRKNILNKRFLAGPWRVSKPTAIINLQGKPQ